MSGLDQRERPPMDRWSTRRGESSGGINNPAIPRTIAKGIEDTDARYPGTEFDDGVMRDRQPFYQRPTYVPPGNNWVNWTEAGPLRPELHMRNVTWRNLVGNSRSRYPVVDSPTTGMHTMTGAAGGTGTAARYQDTHQMVPARVFRLSPGQYNGQNYSQTTTIQGA